MPDARGEEPTLDVARGDRAVSEHLRESLKAMRDDSEDKDFRRLIDDVLKGELSLRQAASTDLFESAIRKSAERFIKEYDQLSESERERLGAEGEAEFALRNEEIREDEQRRA